MKTVPDAVVRLDGEAGLSFDELSEDLKKLNMAPKDYEVRLVVRFLRKKELVCLLSRGRYKICDDCKKGFIDQVRKAFEELPLWRDGAVYGG